MKVKNRRCIRTLSFRQLKASKSRNLIAVFAIALTTLLFTSLFTIALSINDGFQQSNFRQCGGWNHGSFKYLTEEQFGVAIARALASKPAIILADEPTGNLDSKTSQDVLGLLKVTSQKYGQTIVMITHNEEIAQLADRIIRIEDGKIVERR